MQYHSLAFVYRFLSHYSNIHITTSGVKHSTKLDCFTPPFVAQTWCAERYSSYSFAQLHFEDMAAKSVPPDVLRKYDVENEIARYVDVTFNFMNFINLPPGNTLLLQCKLYNRISKTLSSLHIALCTVVRACRCSASAARISARSQTSCSATNELD